MKSLVKAKALCAVSLLLFTSAAFADVPQVLTYRGVLRRTGGYERAMSLEMTFRLYDSKAPDTALWARMMRVPVDTNGIFYAELADTNGNDPDGIGYTLADAMGAIKGCSTAREAPQGEAVHCDEEAPLAATREPRATRKAQRNRK